MKVSIFTGMINLGKENTDVRKKYILEKLKYFNQVDIKLEIVTPQFNKSALPLYNNIEYNTYKFINRKHLKLISTSIYSVSKLVKLNSELIHCNTHQAALLAWSINQIRKKKYIIIFEPMGLGYEETKLYKKNSFKFKLLEPSIKLTERLLYEKSDAVIVYTNIFREHVSKEFGVDVKKVFVVPHGVNLKTEHATDKINKSSICKMFNIPETNKLVMYGGSLSELHGTPYLLEAINFLSKKRQDISFLILGRGGLENRVKSYIKNKELTNVYLLGFVSSEEFGLYLSQADILLIPHAKCMQTELDPPTKLLEYLLSSKPVVSFNLKAISEIVNDNAILVEPDNPKALADGILSLVDNEELCRELGEKGKAIVKEYSWEESAKKQYEIYKYIYKNYIDNQSCKNVN